MSAFTDYASFKIALESWADNDDVALRSDDMIELAHTRLNRVLRLENMTTLASATTRGGDPWLPKPDGYLGMRRLKTTDDRGHGLDYVNLGKMDDDYPTHILGYPEVFTVVGDRIRIGPVPEGAYEVEIAYYKRVLTLSPTVPTNVFLTDTPDLLLFGSLIEAEDWLKDDPRFPRWMRRYEDALAEIRADSQDERFPDGQVSMRAV